MKPTPVRFALVGTGLFARSQHLPNLLAGGGAQLGFLCDVDPQALAAASEMAPGIPTTNDFLEAVGSPQVDAVVLGTTEALRLPVIEAAAALGKPVYCEKPLAATLAEARAIETVVNTSGIPFCVGHNRRCSPAMVEARKIFRNHRNNPGACAWRYRRPGGPALEAESGQAAVFIRINDDWWSWKAVHLQGENAEIGLLIAENTHFADMASWLLDAEPVEVMTLASGITQHVVAIKYEGGHMASICSSANGTFGYPKELYECIGNGGVVVVDGMLEVRTAGVEGVPERMIFDMVNDRHPHLGTEGGLAGWREKKRAACMAAAESGDPLSQFTAEPDKGHARMLEAFVSEIRGESPPVSPVGDAVRALRICLASVRSKREKRAVLLSEIH
jgi:predicted dehydrogenase